jgi:hypothetical protein
MADPTPLNANEMAARARFARIGVWFWGLPMAVTCALVTHWRAAGPGFTWRSLWSVEFAVRFVVSLYVGSVAGRLFGAAMFAGLSRFGANPGDG